MWVQGKVSRCLQSMFDFLFAHKGYPSIRYGGKSRPASTSWCSWFAARFTLLFLSVNFVVRYNKKKPVYVKTFKKVLLRVFFSAASAGLKIIQVCNGNDKLTNDKTRIFSGSGNRVDGCACLCE